MKNTNSKSTYTVSAGLQKVFISAAVLAYIVPIMYFSTIALQQTATNPNLSAYYWVLTDAVITPLLFFAVSHFLGTKGSSGKGSFFEKMLLTVTGMFFFSACNIIGDYLISMPAYAGYSFENWMLHKVVVALVSLVIFTLTVLVLRQRGRW